MATPGGGDSNRSLQARRPYLTPHVRIAVDQTGMGEAVVEAWQGRFGRTRVEGVLLTGPRRLDLATTLREALEDRRLRLPADEALRRDASRPAGAPALRRGPPHLGSRAPDRAGD